ncbi:heme ABC transporter ATP-binding protein [Corynebacterium sp. TA-R-1]|uniref:Heme ABC transporter ATP-binding protein n=1 Tax=Corynebacterium stercoris TaxID=2943490 RepID=A0ABT1G4P9_9CORY|nr:heme ABC transporter ATP-binding protein [Corynebacterium stercoris]MCP1387692.1 heme ABC transporter ATP-binding protein [Corynebacterium stercoris]
MTVEAHNITVRIGDAELLSDVSFHAAPGTVTGLIGPNGAGKSTLLAALSGDIPVASGVLQIGGVEPRHTKPKEMARKRAVMLQDVSVSFAFLVRDVVAMGRSPWEGITSPEVNDAIIDAALDATGVSHLAGREIVTLSGGERARVAMSRVLAQTTPVVFFDEPTAALDVKHQERALGLIRQAARSGSTVVVVLHDLNAAANYCDRVTCLNHGRVAASGPVEQVFTSETLSAVYEYPLEVRRHGGAIHVSPARTDADALGARARDLLFPVRT